MIIEWMEMEMRVIWGNESVYERYEYEWIEEGYMNE